MAPKEYHVFHFHMALSVIFIPFPGFTLNAWKLLNKKL